MKRKHVRIAALLVALFGLGILPANALQDTQVKAIHSALTNIPALELAPKASSIVEKANAIDRNDVAVAVVRDVLSKKPLLASTIVDAVLQVAPEASGAVAEIASKLCPSQAEEIARIAAEYAPDQATQIAASVAKADPKSALKIVRRVVGVAPELTDRINEAVIGVVPSSKAEIENDPTLSLISSFAKNSRSSASQPVRKFIGKRPNRNPPTTPPTATVNIASQVRSQVAEDAVKAINASSASAKLDVGLQAKLITETIKTINAVVKPNSGFTKQEQENLITQTSTTVTKIVDQVAVASKGTPLTIEVINSKIDLAASSLTTVATVAKDTTLSAAEKNSISSFVTTQTTSLSTDTTANSDAKAIVAAIKTLVEEVKKVSEIAKTTDDPKAIQAQLDVSARDIGDTVKAYAKP